MTNLKLKYLHVGHHKCGSSFIQFNVLPNIKYLKQPQFDSGGKINNKNIFKYITEESDIYFSFDHIKKDLFKLFENNNINCISYEGFTGHNDCLNGSIFKYLPNRLIDIFNPEKILIVVRNQKDLLLSWYLDDIKFGYSVNFNDWLNAICENKKINKLKYYYMINKYIDLAGKEKVKVLKFENLFKNNSKELFSFFNADEADHKYFISRNKKKSLKRNNTSINLNTYYLLRFVNSISSGKNNIKPGLLYKIAKKIQFNNLLVGKKINYKLLGVDEINLSDMLKNYFESDNYQLSSLLNEDFNYDFS